MLATSDASVDIVKELLSKGAAVNKKTKNGATALTVATQNKNEELIKILKNAGAK